MSTSNSTTPKRAKKKAVYTWTNSEKNTRRVKFDAGKKIGFVLGNDCDIVKVRDGTQAFWKGVQEGSKIIRINGSICDKIAVKPALSNAVNSGKDFILVLQVPMTAEQLSNDGIDMDIDMDKREALKKAQQSSKATQQEASPAAADAESKPEESQEKQSETTEKEDKVSVSQKNEEEKVEEQPQQQNSTIWDPQDDDGGIWPDNSHSDEPLLKKYIASLEGENKQLRAHIKALEQAMKELQEKATKQLVSLKDENMRKSAKNMRLERQVMAVQNERNILRRQILKQAKHPPTMSAAPKGLRAIPETRETVSPKAATSNPTFSTANSFEGKRVKPELPNAPSEMSVDVFYSNPQKMSMQNMWKGAKEDIKSGRARNISISTVDFDAALNAPFAAEMGNVHSVAGGSRHERTYSDAPTEWTEITVPDVPSPAGRQDAFSPHFNQLNDESFVMERQSSFGNINEVDDDDDDYKTIVSRGDSVIVMSEAQIRGIRKNPEAQPPTGTRSSVEPDGGAPIPQAAASNVSSPIAIGSGVLPGVAASNVSNVSSSTVIDSGTVPADDSGVVPAAEDSGVVPVAAAEPVSASGGA